MPSLKIEDALDAENVVWVINNADSSSAVRCFPSPSLSLSVEPIQLSLSLYFFLSAAFQFGRRNLRRQRRGKREKFNIRYMWQTLWVVLEQGCSGGGKACRGSVCAARRDAAVPCGPHGPSEIVFTTNEAEKCY